MVALKKTHPQSSSRNFEIEQFRKTLDHPKRGDPTFPVAAAALDNAAREVWPEVTHGSPSPFVGLANPI